MDRNYYYAIMNGEGTLDYEIYLNTKALLSCQKDFHAFCNRDELQFQIVHQVEELWMKLIAYTLLDIDDFLQQENTNRVVTLFRRIHLALRLMTDQLGLLETMSPKETDRPAPWRSVVPNTRKIIIPTVMTVAHSRS